MAGVGTCVWAVLSFQYGNENFLSLWPQCENNYFRIFKLHLIIDSWSPLHSEELHQTILLGSFSLFECCVTLEFFHCLFGLKLCRGTSGNGISNCVPPPSLLGKKKKKSNKKVSESKSQYPVLGRQNILYADPYVYSYVYRWIHKKSRVDFIEDLKNKGKQLRLYCCSSALLSIANTGCWKKN